MIKKPKIEIEVVAEALYKIGQIPVLAAIREAVLEEANKQFKEIIKEHENQSIKE